MVHRDQVPLVLSCHFPGPPAERTTDLHRRCWDRLRHHLGVTDLVWHRMLQDDGGGWGVAVCVAARGCVES
eukprot:14976397-Heterocapsa_arctica.AAC.1